ncbi:DedA family protein [Arthrobacter dokdonensis]|uniref:DedA family protein n=1 Tax=Arthrobacter dokdonellae TaxID=2211210 RepID=UPI000DE585A5|nr:VTT domain-containing protein [Arthrobacter dokdonellae]
MDLASDSSSHLVGTLWLYPVGAVLVMFPALIPPIPSTTVFVALGAVAGLDGGPNAFLLVAAMIGGALAGDLATYALTKDVGTTRWGSRRGPARQRAVDAATRRLRERTYMFILTSRFIPLGRLSSPIAATVAGYRLRAFMGYSLASAAAVVVALAASLLLGWLLGKVSTHLLDGKNQGPPPAVVP